MPTELLIYGASFLCAVSAAFLVFRPESAMRLPSPMIVERQRSPLWRVLSLAGTLIRQRGRQGEDVRNRLSYTGFKITGAEFRGIKIVSTLVGALAAAAVAQEFGSVNPWVFVLGGGVGFVAPDMWLRGRVAKRQRAIVRLMPEIIDLLLLCIGAGMDFLVSLNKIVAIERFKGEPLVEELSSTLQEIRLGKRRAEALRALAKRVNLQELSSFLRTVIQADRMGTSMAEVLATHAEDLRMQRFIRAERAALQAPIKILGPLIFCIMPCVAIIVGAPIFLQFMRQSPFGQ